MVVRRAAASQERVPDASCAISAGICAACRNRARRGTTARQFLPMRPNAPAPFADHRSPITGTRTCCPLAASGAIAMQPAFLPQPQTPAASRCRSLIGAAAGETRAPCRSRRSSTRRSRRRWRWRHRQVGRHGSRAVWRPPADQPRHQSPRHAGDWRCRQTLPLPPPDPADAPVATGCRPPPPTVATRKDADAPDRQRSTPAAPPPRPTRLPCRASRACLSPHHAGRSRHAAEAGSRSPGRTLAAPRMLPATAETRRTACTPHPLAPRARPSPNQPSR